MAMQWTLPLVVSGMALESATAAGAVVGEIVVIQGMTNTLLNVRINDEYKRI